MNLTGGIGWRMAVALFGLLAALVGYYWVHKPLDPALIASIGGASLDLLTVGLIAAIGGGVGRLIVLRLLGVGTTYTSSLPSRPERLSLEALLGLGALGLLALILGLVGLYQRLPLWGALLLIGLLTLRHVVGWLRDMLALLRRALQPETAWTRFLAVVTGCLLLAALLHALAPPTAFDALNYHLVGPQRYLAAGRVAAQPDNHFLGFPQGVEILYGLAIALFGRDTAPAPLHWLFGLFGLLAVGGLTRRYAGAAPAWLAVTLLLSAMSLWLLFGWPYVDLAVMAYSAAALVCLIHWPLTPSALYPRPEGASSFPSAGRRLGDRGHPPRPVGTRYIVSQEVRGLILIGIYAGLALGVKYTAVGLLLALLVYVAIHAPRQIIRNAFILGVAAFLTFLPWAAKGGLLYDNPVYPFVFGGLNWDAGRANTFSTTGTGLLGSPDAWQLSILPLAATVLGVEKAGGFSFTAGPWLLTAFLLLFLGWRWLDTSARSLARSCLLLLAPMLLFWGLLAAFSAIGLQTRLLIIAMPPAAVAGALGFHSLSCGPRKPLDMGFVARALLILTLAFTLLDAARETAGQRILSYLTANLSREEYRAASLGVYLQAMHHLDTLPDGSTVRLMYEPRAYDCPISVACIPDILFDHWPRPLRQGLAPDEVFQSWKAAGEDYLLLFNPGYDFNAEDTRFIEQNALFPPALDYWMTPLWSDDLRAYTLYSWK